MSWPMNPTSQAIKNMKYNCCFFSFLILLKTIAFSTSTFFSILCYLKTISHVSRQKFFSVIFENNFSHLFVFNLFSFLSSPEYFS